ncbi:Phosphatase NudJ [compost metagenome]
MEAKWLSWAKEIQAIAQTGLEYGKDVYDLERYEALRELSIDIMENYTFESREKIKLSFADDKGYSTPKVDIRGVIFQEGKILMVREKNDGKWALPGGWADIGYSPSEVAAKEIWEESGFEARPIRLLAVMDKKFHGHPPDPYHIYKLFILCEISGGEAAGGVETSEVGFFGEEELPELSVSRNTEAQIRTMFEYLRDPDKPVLLD